jgi:hypothetical protein
MRRDGLRLIEAVCGLEKLSEARRKWSEGEQTCPGVCESREAAGKMGRDKVAGQERGISATT